MRSDTTFALRCLHILFAAVMAVLVAACSSDDDPATNNTSSSPSGPIAATSAPATAVTADGSVQAVDRTGMRSYFGIPFAAPPVGNLRWAPPAAPARWTTTLNNTASANPCLQTSASPFRLANGQEDCLYLDVHAPTTGTGPFPVMVWLHGGAFNTGGTSTYSDPSPLVSKGVVVVNVAYRIGAMGFLAHSVFEADGTGDAPAGSVGNYGIMDQQAALRWVQNNIVAFAGDPDNVTIFGESAGGFSVMTHLASPESAGLFHKAIVQSGGYAFDRQLSKATAEASASTIVTNAINAAVAASEADPCPGGVTAACLRAASTSFVSTRLATAFNAAQSSPVPTIDEYVLTKSIKAAFVAGENARVPVMSGTNQDEWMLFLAIGEIGRRNALGGGTTDPNDTNYLASASGTALTSATYGAVMSAQTGGLMTSGTLTTAYPLSAYSSDPDPSLDPLASVRATAAQGTDFIFACQGYNVPKRVVLQGTLAYTYEFRDQTAIASIGIDSNGDPTIATPQGAAHSYELQYLFNLRDLVEPERSDLQDAMTSYWANFARTSNPNAGVNTVPATWPVFYGNGASDVLGLDVASDEGIGTLSTSFDTAHKCSSLYPFLTF